MEVKVETGGLDELLRVLSPEGIKQALARAAFEAEGEAKRSAPVDTGFLRGSIQVAQVTEREATIGVAAEYGLYVEEGTSRAKAQPYLRPALEKAAKGLEAALSKALRKASS